MIKGIGIDIEEVKRFKRLSYKGNRSFYEKIFTPGEIKYCLSKANAYQHFAARFAAKEAAVKALGDSSVYRARDIEIINNKKGKPLVKCQMSNVKCQFLVSLSHTKDYAMALVLVVVKKFT